jgi:hypothetical protein
LIEEHPREFAKMVESARREEETASEVVTPAVSPAVTQRPAVDWQEEA